MLKTFYANQISSLLLGQLGISARFANGATGNSTSLSIGKLLQRLTKPLLKPVSSSEKCLVLRKIENIVKF